VVCIDLKFELVSNLGDLIDETVFLAGVLLNAVALRCFSMMRVH
jgi:hypothetical protein